MPSFSAWFVRMIIALVINTKAIFSNAEKTRKNIHDLYLRPRSHSPPLNLGRDISVDRVDVHSWPLYRISASTNADPQEKRSAMLYIHGGAFYREIHLQHWRFVAQAARETGLDILVPIYPLIPRPAATAARLADGFLAIIRSSTQRIRCIAGDSAGGMLSLSTAQQLQARHPELAAQLQCLVLISPVVDTSLSHPDVSSMEKNDPWLGIDGLSITMPYLAGGLPMDDPVVSPLFGELDALPPTMLLCGTDDMLCSDARRLSAKFQGKGTEHGLAGSFQNEKLVYVEMPGMIHVYPLLPHHEGAEARNMIMHFIKQYVG